MMATSSRNGSTIVGPQLPPGFKRAEEDDTVLGDTCIGPTLPTSVNRNIETENIGTILGPVPPSDGNESVDVIGPALPPHMRKDYVGPSLPPHMKTKYMPALSSRSVIGPVLPGTNLSGSEEEDDNFDDIGPKLSEAADAETQSKCTASADFERRSEKMKNMILSKDSDVKVREEWMTELPPSLVPQLGLGARTFKKRAYADKNDDRSEWTDTPADRKRKAEMSADEQHQGPSVADMALHRRNREISKNLHHYNKSKRSESLMDMHQKKRKEKKKEKKKEERREFDRDKDLNIQNVDAAQAKSFIDKAKLLGGKFSHGASHFL